jgi:hypothetical protein
LLLSEEESHRNPQELQGYRRRFVALRDDGNEEEVNKLAHGGSPQRKRRPASETKGVDIENRDEEEPRGVARTTF